METSYSGYTLGKNHLNHIITTDDLGALNFNGLFSHLFFSGIQSNVSRVLFSATIQKRKKKRFSLLSDWD